MAKLTVIGVRHGQAAQPEGDRSTPLGKRLADLSRPLNNVGWQQANVRAKRLSSMKFDRVFSSHADRATVTAEIVGGVMRQERSFHTLRELYTPSSKDGEILDQMADILGYQPASAYMAHELNCSDPERYPQDPISRFASTAGHALAPWMPGDLLDEPFRQNTWLVAGHAVLLPLAVLGLVDAVVGANEQVREFLLNLNMEEAGAFRVTFNDYDLTLTEFELL